jgi:hypothetical protein
MPFHIVAKSIAIAVLPLRCVVFESVPSIRPTITVGVGATELVVSTRSRLVATARCIRLIAVGVVAVAVTILVLPLSWFIDECIC